MRNFTLAKLGEQETGKYCADNFPMNPGHSVDEYYWEDYELYHSKEFEEAIDEFWAEQAYLKEHPEERKVYTSTKEMFRDMGFDVSTLPDDDE